MLQGDNGTQARVMGPASILFVSVGPGAEKPPAPRVTEAAISACIAAIESLPNTDPAERVLVFSDGCADIHAENRCRRAWRSVREFEVAERTRIIAEECRMAYCPLLAD